MRNIHKYSPEQNMIFDLLDIGFTVTMMPAHVHIEREQLYKLITGEAKATQEEINKLYAVIKEMRDIAIKQLKENLQHAICSAQPPLVIKLNRTANQ